MKPGSSLFSVGDRVATDGFVPSDLPDPASDEERRIDEYEIRMTCPDCGQYGDGCRCADLLTEGETA